MRKASWFWLGLSVLFIATTAMAGTVAPKAGPMSIPVDENTVAEPSELDDVLWSDDFESGIDSWEFYDAAIQPVMWDTSTYSPNGGSAAARCYNPALGNNGGYASSWLQLLVTDTLDLSGTNPTLDFAYQLECEAPGGEPAGYDAWDGATVMVVYTNTAGEDTFEVISLTSYTSTSLYSFGDEWAYGEGVAGWAGSVAWATETGVDLSPYASYTNPRIAFAFASDGAYATPEAPDLTGFQVDDVVVQDDAGTIFSDDFEAGLGTDWMYMTGAEATPGLDIVPNTFFWEDGVDDAPSPTHTLSQSYALGYSHFLLAPGYFTFPELQPGDDVWLDVSYNIDIADDPAADLGDRWYWNMQVYDYMDDTWYAGDNPLGEGNNYVWPGNTDGWTTIGTTLGAEGWPLTPYAENGRDSVRVRFYTYAPSHGTVYDTAYAIQWDDVEIKQTSLQHDIATYMWVPFPTTVDVPVYGEVYFTNNATNAEDGWVATWGITNPAWPMDPAPPYSIDAGPDTQIGPMAIENPQTPEHDGYWMPTAASEGLQTLVAAHSLAGDQIAENDQYAVDIEVRNDSQYEVGMDTRSATGFVSVFGTGTGPAVRIDPAMVNSDFFQGGPDWDYTYDVGALRLEVTYHSAAGGAPANPEFNVAVYEGGDALGAELYSGTVSLNLDEGTTGAYIIEHDVSAVDALQGLSSDIWVVAEVTQMGPNGSYPQPFFSQTQAHPDWHATHGGFTYDGSAVAQDRSTGHRVSIVVSGMNTVQELSDGNVPQQFELANAYPNPFNPSTTLEFTVPQAANVSLNVYNVMGQQVASLVDRNMATGTYKTVWNAANMASGVYFVRMEADGFNAVRKVMLMK